jgi:hypothetical protein
MRSPQSYLVAALLCGAALFAPRPAAAQPPLCQGSPGTNVPGALQLPGRQLLVPSGCCVSDDPNGGEIRCSGAQLTYAVYPQAQQAVAILEQMVATYRNQYFAFSHERLAVPCAILGVETSCHEFTTEVYPGPPQPARVLLGATTVKGHGVVAMCQYFTGAPMPAVCRQIFTP